MAARKDDRKMEDRKLRHTFFSPQFFCPKTSGSGIGATKFGQKHRFLTGAALEWSRISTGAHVPNYHE